MSDPYRIEYELQKVIEWPPHSFEADGGRVYRAPSVAVCGPPGAWSRLWNSIDHGHVWECPICHTFYEWAYEWDPDASLTRVHWAKRNEEWAEKFRKRNGL